jgi:hypothetical protein
MRRSLYIISFLLFFQAGCASVTNVDTNAEELVLMPKEVALQVVLKHYPESDEKTIYVRGIDTCKSTSRRVPYTEIDAMFHMTFSSIPSTTTAYANWGYWSLCNLGVRARGLNANEATQLAAALNSLGAKIPSVRVSHPG